MKKIMQKNMRLYHFSILLMAVMFSAISCNEKADDAKYNMLKEELKQSYDLSLDKTIKQVVFIGDEGCPNCVTSFSNYVLNNIDKYKDSTLILINSKGRNVDLDRFQALGMKNIIILRKAPDEKKFSPNLGVVYMENKQKTVDTAIYIDAKEIIEQINYIDSKNR